MSTTAPCPACTSSASAGELVVREMMFGLDAAFRYGTCADCGTVHLLEVPDDYAPYYPDDYYSVDLDPENVLGRRPVRDVVRLVGASELFGGRRVSGAAALVPKRQFRTLLSLLRSVRLAGLPSGRETTVLDVGCGSGMLVFALGVAGMTHVTGVDPFAPSDRELSSGGELLRRGLDEVEGTYQLVMFHHSLEHVLDVRESLEQARSVLAPGGRVLVRMPTVSSSAYDAYGVDWVQFDAPRHVTLLSRAGVEAVSEKAGLRVVALQDDSTGFQFWGSEQVRRGIALNAATSHMVDPSRSPFGSRQLHDWERRAAALNRAGRGDQAAWVLAAS